MDAKVRVTPEIDAELHEWLVKEAEDQNRTLHGQIGHILQSYRKRLNSGVPVIGHGQVIALQKNAA